MQEIPYPTLSGHGGAMERTMIPITICLKLDYVGPGRGGFGRRGGGSWLDRAYRAIDPPRAL